MCKRAHRSDEKQTETKAILYQDASWYDQQEVGNLVKYLSEDIDTIESAIGVYLTDFIQNLTSFVAGLVIAFVSIWKLTLVACSMLPLIVAGFVSFGVISRHFLPKEFQSYAKASSIAEEVFRAIQTVFAFGGEEREISRYSEQLDAASVVGVKQASCYGLAGGFISFSIYSSAALVFWYGVSLMRKEECDAGSVVLVFLNLIIGSLFLGGALPNVRYFYAAKASAERLFRVIEREPPIDSRRGGLRPNDFFRTIQFQDVTFSYSSRPSNVVLRKLNLSIERDQTVAFVGPSGCGKSTVMHLLLRFYDPTHDLNLDWYRSQIGIVPQEPIMFTGTIYENIRLGDANASEDQVTNAAKLADAHQFIMQFPEGYSTKITQASTCLSTGQKQRIAIARALVRNPRILILDEATSALDCQSELSVQTALENACAGRTVVIVAHRLSTVLKADKIFVLEDGCIQESGTHSELCQLDGLYAVMFAAQRQTVKQDCSQKSLDSPPDIGDGDNSQEALRPSNLVLNSLEDLSCDLEVDAVNPKTSVVVDFPSAPSALLRVMKMSKPEAAFIVAGSFFAALSGLIQPMFAILYAETYNVFTMSGNPRSMDARINLLTGIMTFLGLLRLVSSTVQAYFFGVAGERLVKRLRILLFRAILRQELAWFEDPDNHIGRLTNMLACETNKIRPLCGSAMGRIVESSVLVVLSLAIAFHYSWKLTLVVTAFVPVVVLSSFLNVRHLKGNVAENRDNVAIQVAYEALFSSRTVSALGLESHFHRKYATALQEEKKSHRLKSLAFGLVYALAQSLPICSYAAAFSYGGMLMSQNEISLIAIFRVFAAINFAAQALGRSSHFGVDMRNAIRAFSKIWLILDRKSAIPVDQGIYPQFDLNSVTIKFEHISFSYGTRPGAMVLKDLSHIIKPGQKIALVGHSGCGKTTLLKLLQRFYRYPRDPTRGIFLGDISLNKIAPRWIRSQIGFVDQEPRLFNLSMRENIAYGDNTRIVSLDEVIDAARRAHVHEFIAGLPQGYETPLGPRACELSVGQKQRVAIARMYIHRPNLLLLDEVTSALDARTEEKIQLNLERFLQGKTAIISAHRLSVIQKTDLVIVLADGVKVEEGTIEELAASKGAFEVIIRSQ
ncbi:unnamed protein product [Dicrocoelium dendriticum]|nr:unnamed protein product [Dicrocoelium dendriticum]